MQELRQNSGTGAGSGVTISIGPVLDSVGAEYAGLVIADVTLVKNGVSAAMAASATLTHVSNGFYDLVTIGNNADTLGRLKIRCNKATYQFPPLDFMVRPVTVFDALVTNAINATGGLVGATAAITGMSGVIANTTGAVGSVTGAVGSVTGAVGSVTGAVGSVVGLTAANLDAAVSSRLAATIYVAPTNLTAGQIATGVWQDTTAGDFTAALSVGKSLMNGVTLGTGLTIVSVSGAVGSIAPGGIAAASFAAGAIDAAAIANSAIDRATFAADTGLQSVRSNTAQAGAAGTITLDASASATTDFYLGQWIYLTGATGVGQSRLITAYNGTTKVATIAPNWATNPDVTSTFAIYPAAKISGVTLADTLTNLPTIPTDWITANGIAADAIGSSELAASAVAEILTTQMTESYAADGVAPTLAQALFLIQQAITEFSIATTTTTIKKIDGTTTAATLTLNSATVPTSVTRAT